MASAVIEGADPVLPPAVTAAESDCLAAAFQNCFCEEYLFMGQILNRQSEIIFLEN